MELREYGQILLRRWWIPVVLVLLTGILSTFQLKPWQPLPVTYQTSVKLLLGVMPLENTNLNQYDPRYFAWLISEYLVDDFTEVVGSGLFAHNVSERLSEQEIQIPAGLIQGSATTGKQHRIITLSLSWSDAEELRAIVDAATAELLENAEAYFQQLGTEGAEVAVLGDSGIQPSTPDIRSQVELPLRVVLALIVGIGLIFLLDYLNTSVRDRKDLEQMGFAIIGEIPKS